MGRYKTYKWRKDKDIQDATIIKEYYTNKQGLLKEKRALRKMVLSKIVKYKDVSSLLSHRAIARKVHKQAITMHDNWDIYSDDIGYLAHRYMQVEYPEEYGLKS